MAEPEADRGYVDEAQEALGGLVVAGGDAAGVLQFVEAALDQVTQTVSLPLRHRPRRNRHVLALTINGLFKAGVIHSRGHWRSFEAVEYDTLEWVDWFNNRRLIEPIGNIPPAEAEAKIYAALEIEAMAA